MKFNKLDYDFIIDLFSKNMFSGHPGLAANGPVPAPNVDAQKLVLAIKDQT